MMMGSKQLTDLEFIDAVKSRDEGKISRLYIRLNKSTMPFLYNKYGINISQQDLEDLFQDSFAILCAKLSDPKFELTAQISTFFTQICIFRCSKLLKKKNFEILGEPTELDLEELYGTSRYSSEVIESLNETLATLGSPCKEILTLFYFDNLSHQEIAKKLKMANANTSKSTATRCKKKLKDGLQKVIDASKR